MPEFHVTFGSQYRAQIHPVHIGDSRIHPDGWLTLVADDGMHATMAAMRLFGNSFSMVRTPSPDDLGHFPRGELAVMTAPPRALLELLPITGHAPPRRSSPAVSALWIPQELNHPMSRYTGTRRHQSGPVLRTVHLGLVFNTDPLATAPNHRANAILSSWGFDHDNILRGDVVVTVSAGFHGTLVKESIIGDHGDRVWDIQAIS